MTEQDLTLMRKCALSEWKNPHIKDFGPDCHAAINAYLQHGGRDGENDALEDLFREACEAEGLDY